jgi:hypothetical protein
MAPASPIPRRQVRLEVARFTALLGSLTSGTALLAAVGAWAPAALLGAFTAAVATTGVVGSRAQIAAARHPAEVTSAVLTPWRRGKQAWALLATGHDDGDASTTTDPDGLCVELRWLGQARGLAPGPIPVLVAGRLEAGAHVVLQAAQVTIWPSGPVRARLPAGVRPVEPRRRRPVVPQGRPQR